MVKGTKDAREVLKAFNRWPTWMWANEEIADFIQWLKLFNMGEMPKKKLDFMESMYTVCGNQWKKFFNIYPLLKNLE